MQISEQVLQVLLAEFLIEAGHLISPKPDDVADTLIVRRQAAQREIFVLVHAFESRAFFPTGRIRLVATIALGIVDPAARRLLGAEPKFGVRLAPRDVARKKKGTQQERRHSRCDEEMRATLLARNALF